MSRGNSSGNPEAPRPTTNVATPTQPAPPPPGTQLQPPPPPSHATQGSATQPQFNHTSIPEYANGIYNFICGILSQHSYNQSLLTHFKRQYDEIRVTLQDSESRFQEAIKKLEDAVNTAKNKEDANRELSTSLERERVDFKKQLQHMMHAQTLVQARADEMQKRLSDALTTRMLLSQTMEEHKKTSDEQVQKFREEIQRLQEENKKLVMRPSSSVPPEIQADEEGTVDLSQVVPDYSLATINWMRRQCAVYREETESLEKEREKLLDVQKLPEELEASRLRIQSLETLVETLKSTNQKLDDSLNSERGQIVELVRRVDQAQSLQVAALQEAGDMKHKIITLEEAENLLQEELNKAHERAESAEEEITQYTEEISRYVTLVETLRADSRKTEAMLNEELKTSRQTCTIVIQDLKKTHEKVKRLQRQLYNSEKREGELGGELKIAHESYATTADDLSEALAKMAKMTDENKRLQEQLRQAKGERDLAVQKVTHACQEQTSKEPGLKSEERRLETKSRTASQIKTDTSALMRDFLFPLGEVDDDMRKTSPIAGNPASKKKPTDLARSNMKGSTPSRSREIVFPATRPPSESLFELKFHCAPSRSSATKESPAAKHDGRPDEDIAKQKQPRRTLDDPSMSPATRPKLKKSTNNDAPNRLSLGSPSSASVSNGVKRKGGPRATEGNESKKRKPLEARG